MSDRMPEFAEYHLSIQQVSRKYYQDVIQIDGLFGADYEQ
jgi:hypothetical protein